MATLVTGRMITDSSINTADIAAGAVGVSQLSAGAVAQSFGNTSGAFNFRNKIINGNFDIWQRGITFTNSVNTHQYTADRWWVFGGTSTIASCNRFTLTNSDLDNFYFASRVQRVAGNTGTAAVASGQVFETAHSIPLAGKTITLSFYARRGPNFSAASNILQAAVFTGTGIDQSVGSLLTQTWSGYSNALTASVPITTTFQRYTISLTLPTNITQAAVLFIYNGTGTAGAGDYFDITGIQLEEGSIATPFEQRPTALEYSMCQRYYEICTFRATGVTYRPNGDTRGGWTFKVTKRIAPTISPSEIPISVIAFGYNGQGANLNGSLFFATDIHGFRWTIMGNAGNIGNAAGGDVFAWGDIYTNTIAADAEL